nr:uncharacterized protein LOC107436115 [Parasteatoda tepidariorum]XP_042912832.1 uncharacterized protein LOC107436115 [Parasteatoda tepidariorum]
MDGNISLKRKYAETQGVTRKGIFKDGCFPDHVYPLGDNFFLTVSEYKSKISIHIRRYNKHGDMYYPSADGITLQPEQYNVCFSHEPPTSIFDIVEINLQLEAVSPHGVRDFYLLMSDSGNYTLTHEYTCRSGRVYKFPTDITFAQWSQIRKIRDEVNTSFITVKYKCRDFKETFKMCNKSAISEEKPESNRYSEAEYLMNQCLKQVLYRHIGQKKGLSPPIIADELLDSQDVVSISDFNESCMYLNVYSIAHDFKKELQEKKLYPENVPLMNFMNEHYLNEIHLDQLLLKAKNDFCSCEIFE